MITRKRKSDLIDDEDDDAESDHQDIEESNPEPETNNINHRHSNTARTGHIKNQESLVSFMGDKIMSPQRKC
jgi:hypothetical protein